MVNTYYNSSEIVDNLYNFVNNYKTTFDCPTTRLHNAICDWFDLEYPDIEAHTMIIGTNIIVSFIDKTGHLRMDRFHYIEESWYEND